MDKILKPGQYGLINGRVFYDVDFESCSNLTKLPNYEIEKRLLKSTDVRFVSQGEVLIDGKLFEKFYDTITYYDEDYTINFAIQILSGILYVIEVKYE